MFTRILLLSLVSILAFSAPAVAKTPTQKTSASPTRTDGIAAVVNDGIVTRREVEDRLNLILSSSRIKPDEKARGAMRSGVLESLITEQVQLQEAKANGLLPTETQIQEALGKIAAENKLTTEQFLTLITRSGANPASLQRQIAAQLAWSQLVQKTVRPLINVSESEIAAEKERIKQFAGQNEYLLAEIYLPFEGPASEAETKALADRMVTDMKKGARFSELARQFSKSPTAQGGGMLGWLRDDQLTATQIASIKGLSKEMPLSTAMRGDSGYYIYLLRETRPILAPDAVNAKQDTQFDLRDLSVPITSTPEAARARADAIRKETGTCETVAKRVSQESDLQLEPQQLRLSTLSDTLAKSLETAQAGNVLPLPETEKAVRLRFVCTRTALTTSDVDEQIANRLGTARLETMAKRYLRDLMASAFIERR